jgi:hypothetical protein
MQEFRIFVSQFESIFTFLRLRGICVEVSLLEQHVVVVVVVWPRPKIQMQELSANPHFH